MLRAFRHHAFDIDLAISAAAPPGVWCSAKSQPDAMNSSSLQFLIKSLGA